MVLAFKVWRIGWEKRGKVNKDEGEPPSFRVKVLCLRDKNGRLIRVSRNETEQQRLAKWYEKYQMKTRLENMMATNELKQHIRKIKRRIRKKGFTCQISFYGIFIDPETLKKSYRRYEIFHEDKWKPDEVGMMHHFFMKHVPKSRAGVFIYHHDKLYVDEQDELTKLVKPVG